MEVDIRDFGGNSNDGNDDTAALNAAKNEISATGGVIYLPSGTQSYNVSSEIALDEPGICLRGDGPGATWFSEQNATIIRGGHTTGSVVRIKREGCGVRDILIGADGTRKAAARNTTAAGFNAGIRVEADDVAPPYGNVMNTTIDNVMVKDQPNDGTILIGRAYYSQLRNLYNEFNNGHGLTVDAGNRTGRTNLQPPGLITVIGGHSALNNGHGAALGNPADDGSVLLPSLRCLFFNWESFMNENASALRYDNYDVYVRGDGHEFLLCAFSGRSLNGTAQHHNGVAVAGRDNVFEVCRYLDTIQPAKVFSRPGVTTTGTRFLGMGLRGNLSTTPVTIAPDTKNTIVQVTDISDTTAAVWAAQAFGDDIRYDNRRTVHGRYNVSDLQSGREITLMDDGVATLEFDGTAYGTIDINGTTEASGPCTVAFRVGTFPFCTLKSRDTGYVATGVGSLSGGATGGTDNKINVYAHTDNKLYIKNRTNGPRVYNYTLLSMNGGMLLPGQ